MTSSTLGLNISTLRNTLPVFSTALGLLGIIGGIINFTDPALGAKSFGIDLHSTTPSVRDLAYVRIHGVRNIKDGLLNIILTGFLVFSDVCRTSEVAASVVRKCIGMTLVIRSLVGFADGWVVGEYVGSQHASERKGKQGDGKASVATPVKFAVGVAALGAAYLFV